MKKYSRIDKLNKLVRRVLGNIIEKEYDFADYGMISVFEVSIAPDLRNADVFISVYDGKSEDVVIEKLQKDEYKIKKLLAAEVRMKYLPKLHFKKELKYDKAQEVFDILEKIRRDSESDSSGDQET